MGGELDERGVRAATEAVGIAWREQEDDGVITDEQIAAAAVTAYLGVVGSKDEADS